VLRLREAMKSYEIDGKAKRRAELTKGRLGVSLYFAQIPVDFTFGSTTHPRVQRRALETRKGGESS
jgi:hypothetical protein